MSWGNMIVLALATCLYLVGNSLVWRRLGFEETPQLCPIRDAPNSSLMAEMFSNQYLAAQSSSPPICACAIGSSFDAPRTVWLGADTSLGDDKHCLMSL
jgi:hypothetical protein